MQVRTETTLARTLGVALVALFLIVGVALGAEALAGPAAGSPVSAQTLGTTDATAEPAETTEASETAETAEPDTTEDAQGDQDGPDATNDAADGSGDATDDHGGDASTGGVEASTSPDEHGSGSTETPEPSDGHSDQG